MAPPSSKRRKLHYNPKGPAVEQLTFDPTARQEYLTGFHKRKEQRRKHAQEVAAKQEKEDKVQERKELREKRKRELEIHVKEFNHELQKQNPDLNIVSEEGAESPSGEEEWDGIVEDAGSHADADGVEGEDEFVDEDKYTTVTVEAMGGSIASDDERTAEGEEKHVAGLHAANGTKKRKQRPEDGKAKVKKKKFRYESKLERQATRKKQSSTSRAAKARRQAKS